MSKQYQYNTFQGETAERVEIMNTYMYEDDNSNLKCIVYRLKKILNNNETIEFYKASSFFRLTRVSKESKENKRFMDIHCDIMRALYASNISMIEIIANVLKPVNEGLIFLYGVQATGATEKEAISYCMQNFNGFLRSFQGTHRTAHVELINKSTFQWIYKKLQTQKYTSVIKGLPQARDGSGANRNIMNFDTDTNEQIEQFLAGANEFEFCLMIMATPMNNKYINHWLTKSLETQTKWESQKQGSKSMGLNVGIPMSISMNNSSGTSANISRGTSNSTGTSQSTGTSHSIGTNNSASFSNSEGRSSSTGTSSGTSQSFSQGTSQSQNSSSSASESASHSSGTSNSTGTSSSQGTSTSDSLGGSVGVSFIGSANVNYSHGWGSNSSTGSSTTSGTSSSDSTSTSNSFSQGSSSGTSTSEGYGFNQGTSTSQGTNSSISQSQSSGSSTSDGTSTSNGTSTSAGSSYSRSGGSSNSTSNGYSTGLNVGFNISKSYNWVDKTVEYVCQCLEMQNMRLKKMLEGSGGFFVDAYLATDTPENLKALETLSTTTWVNPNAKIDVLRMETPTRIGQKNISMHLQAMSPCLEIEKEPGGTGFYYKYSSILTSDELTAYTHPPRITIGGIDNSMEDVPPLRVPTNCQNKEIFIGNIVNGEKYSFESANKYGNGYVTDIKFCIGNNEMHHAFIAGGSRSGKSVLAARAAIEMYKNAPYVNKKTQTKTHKRVFVLDPKGEWREMASLVPKGKFKFYSVGKPGFHPLPLNLLRVPIGVTPYQYYNLVIEHFCSAYGLLDRAIAQIGGVLYDLYEQNDVFGHEEDPTWANEHSKNITLTDVYDQIEKKLHEAEAKRNQHDAEALQTYLTRLDMYHRKHSAEYIMFCNRGGDSCDILLGEDDFTVVESNGLSEKSQRFFFILFMNAIYESALSRGSTGFYNGSYETVIILEEANSILIASGSDDTSGQASINRFNQILDKSASLGLFIWTITQKISSMPESIIANSGIIFVGRIGQKKDHDVVNGVLGFNDKMDFKVDKFYSRLAVGIFIGRVTKGMNFDEQTPFLVKSKMLKTYVPSDKELDALLQEHEYERQCAKEEGRVIAAFK